MYLYRFKLQIIKYMDKPLWKLKMLEAAEKTRELQEMRPIFLQDAPQTQ
jgi:hypothetical protein